MLIPLVMPVDTPLWMVAVGSAFAVVIGKEVFGGTGMNVLNVALTARAFLFFAYPTMMSGDKVWVNTGLEDGQKMVDGFSGATSLGHAATANMAGVVPMLDTFWGFEAGSIGETSAFACLIGAAILVLTGIGSWRIMLAVLLGGVAMAGLFNWWGRPLAMPTCRYPYCISLMLGSFFFGLVFMATDPVTAAQTNTGKWIYGFLIGVMAILIRVVNPAYPEGMMLAILFMNVMAPDRSLCGAGQHQAPFEARSCFKPPNAKEPMAFDKNSNQFTFIFAMCWWWWWAPCWRSPTWTQAGLRRERAPREDAEHPGKLEREGGS
jgi:Na+-transporting NADH:ubiquinone oxidoreductase subunit B